MRGRVPRDRGAGSRQDGEPKRRGVVREVRALGVRRFQGSDASGREQASGDQDVRRGGRRVISRADARRYEDDWRNREVGRSIPVAAETPNEDAGGTGGGTGGDAGKTGGERRRRGAIGSLTERRFVGATGIDARRRRARAQPRRAGHRRRRRRHDRILPRRRLHADHDDDAGARAAAAAGGFVHRGSRRGEGRERRNVPRDVRGRRRARRRRAARRFDHRPTPSRRLRLRGRLRRVRAAGSMRRGEGRVGPRGFRVVFEPSSRRGAWSRTTTLEARCHRSSPGRARRWTGASRSTRRRARRRCAPRSRAGSGSGSREGYRRGRRARRARRGRRSRGRGFRRRRRPRRVGARARGRRGEPRRSSQVSRRARARRVGVGGRRAGVGVVGAPFNGAAAPFNRGRRLSTEVR